MSRLQEKTFSPSPYPFSLPNFIMSTFASAPNESYNPQRHILLLPPSRPTEWHSPRLPDAPPLYHGPLGSALVEPIAEKRLLLLIDNSESASMLELHQKPTLNGLQTSSPSTKPVCCVPLNSPRTLFMLLKKRLHPHSHHPHPFSPLQIFLSHTLQNIHI